jgi:predicted dehydrogenase
LDDEEVNITSSDMSSTATATLNTRPLKVGFVGLSASGWASQVLAPALLDPEVQEHFKLVAVSTTKAESAAASAQNYSQLFKHEIKAYHGDVSQIASDPDVDFVAVAVRAQSHKDIVKKVIENGKPFFVEWPVGRNVEETRELATLAREKGLKTLVGLQGRQSNITQKVPSISILKFRSSEGLIISCPGSKDN